MYVFIPKEKALNGEAFDVFIALLVQDLLLLWEEVPTLDTSGREVVRQFILRGVLLWMVNDFPTYGLIGGQQTKGYKGCPVCVIETCAQHSKMLSKTIYLENWTWLPKVHHFRRARTAFDGNSKKRGPPSKSSENDIP